MDFSLSPEQKAIQAVARRFAQEEVKPQVREMEKNGTFPRQLIRRMGEMGFLGATFPKEVGGSEIGFLSLVLIMEEVGKVFPALAFAFNLCGMTCPFTILNWGTKEQYMQFVPPLIAGQKVGFFGLTEPGGGSDAMGAMQSRAVKKGDHYVLNGSKMFTSFAKEADWGIIMAKTNPDAGHRGVTAFIVPTSTPGFKAEKISTSPIGQSASTCAVFLEDVKVPVANRLGEEGEGFKIAMNALDYGRLTVPTRVLAIAQALLEESLRYCQERHAFGQPIGRFQMVQHQLADMVTEIEAARLMIYRSAWLKDCGFTATRESAISKYFASEVACRVGSHAMEIFGGYSVTDEYPINRWFNWTYMFKAGEGSANIQRVLIAEDAMGWKPADRHSIKRKFPLESDVTPMGEL